MNNDLQYMFRKIILFSSVVAMLSVILICAIFNNYIYSILFIFGLVVSLSLFILNGIITEFLFTRSSFNPIAASKITTITRIALVCFIGLEVYKFNKDYILAFMLGYCSFFLSILIYGINLSKKGSD